MIAIGACHMSGHMRELRLAPIVQIGSTVLYSLALSSLTACKTIAYAGKSVGLKCPIQHFVIQTWVLSLPKHSAASSSAFGTVCVLVTLQALTVSTITPGRIDTARLWCQQLLPTGTSSISECRSQRCLTCCKCHQLRYRPFLALHLCYLQSSLLVYTQILEVGAWPPCYFCSICARNV